jgi:hypothetical protein
MNLAPHDELKCELYRRQLLQSGVDEHMAASQVSVLAHVLWTVRQNREMRERLRERYRKTLWRMTGLAFGAGLVLGWLSSYSPKIWG